jgi:ABC-type ATPase with predicted acetyltransferase domain
MPCSVRIGAREFKLRVKEVSSEREFAAYQQLAELHYRNQAKHGRSAALIIRAHDAGLPVVLGYIELATPFYFNKPRTALLDAPFSSGLVSWRRWDAAAIKRYLGLSVRIARCVVAPEFRGLGLSELLVSHARRFARRRWQTGGVRPQFIEISADMLKFVPFAEKAGLHYIGHTEGNLGRVATDMDYLTRNAKRVRAKEIVQEEACGIVDQQVKRMEHALHVMRQHGIRRDDFVGRLRQLTESRVIRDFALLSEIVSLPKPSFMGGLYRPADRFIQTRVKALGITRLKRPTLRKNSPSASPLIFEDVSAEFVTRVRRNRRTHAVHQAFGISPDRMVAAVISDLSFQVRPGEILLVTGPSGAGKSVLLDLIGGRHRRGMKVQGKIVRPTNARFGRFAPLRSNVSLVELFGKGDVAAGLDLLSRVGLSDAFLFLRRFNQLSTGQQHRAMLADLVRRSANIALVDEFCSALDPITANVVAFGMRRIAKQVGISLVVAAAHYESFIDSLQPDKVIVLGSYGEHSVCSGDAFLRAKGTRKSLAFNGAR